MKLRTRILILVALAATLLTPTSMSLAAADSDTTLLHSDLRTAAEVASLVKLNFVDPVSTSELMAAFMKTDTVEGMLASLGDDYTRYIGPEAYAKYIEGLEGTFSGIGITMEMLNGVVTVVNPIPGTPAEKAGLLPGDAIIAVDGTPTEDKALEEAVSMIRGPEGTAVVLTIRRADGSERDVAITRGRIVSPTVYTEMLDDELGYLQLVQFAEESADQVKSGLEELTAKGTKGIILDLRYNGGGLFDQAIRVASLFIPDGPIVHRVGRDGRRVTQMRVDSPLFTMPMVVLVNEWTASSSEIVAGALKDRGRAPLVGKTTFGKGVVQGVLNLSNGGALSVTTDRYLTAGGNSIHKKGIEPDYPVELVIPSLDGSADAAQSADATQSVDATQSADATRSADATGAVEAAEGSNAVDGAESTGSPDAKGSAEAKEFVDTQLEKAKEVLRSLIADQSDDSALPKAS